MCRIGLRIWPFHISMCRIGLRIQPQNDSVYRVGLRRGVRPGVCEDWLYLQLNLAGQCSSQRGGGRRGEIVNKKVVYHGSQGGGGALLTKIAYRLEGNHFTIGFSHFVLDWQERSK